MEHIKKRILSLFTENGLTVNKASLLLEMPQRTLNRQLNEGGNVSVDLLRAILRCFPSVSVEWILGGKGEMYKQNDGQPAPIAAYYDSLTVSAGVRDVVDGGNEAPAGYVSIPNVNAEFFFPVAGTSMQPEINEGDIIGVNSMDSFSVINADKTYMIVTREGRMIKHCSPHESNDELIVCSSPNYRTFVLRKEDILSMYEVVVKICEV
ncbi:MAG: LexA family transcriptional regulator [Bacteroidaceae bacterium]|nr:LexA family transcriptional regulator [Bacteroidaceae bacterium]